MRNTIKRGQWPACISFIRQGSTFLTLCKIYKNDPEKDRANEKGSTKVLLASNSPSLPERALVWSLESAIKDMGKDSAPENSSLGKFQKFRKNLQNF